MKRILAILMVLTVVMGCLAACGSQGNTGSTSGNAAAESAGEASEEAMAESEATAEEETETPENEAAADPAEEAAPEETEAPGSEPAADPAEEAAPEETEAPESEPAADPAEEAAPDETEAPESETAADPAEEAAPEASETPDVSDMTLSAPSGAPALAVATLAVENPDNYTFLTAETIPAEFSNASADFIIAPLNAGAKLYAAGKSTYKLGAVVAWGNLFFASQKADFTLEDVNGGSITLFGENTINSSIALYVLAENGIVPANVDYLAGAANTQSLLLSDPEAIVLTAEPALTAARSKNENITSYSVNELYKAATGNDGFAQAGLFIKAETIETRPEAVDAFLALVAESADKCVNDIDAVAEAAAALEILPNAKIAKAALPNCTVRYMAAWDAREQVETTANIDLSQYGGAVPADDFYYGTK